MKALARLQTHADWGLLALRLAVGSIFLIHGIQKWAFWSVQPSEQMSAQMINLFKFLSVVEPLGGIALIFGFLTQYAALGLGLIMIGAIRYKIAVWNIGFSASNATGWEYDYILLAANLCLFFTGAGKLALDKFINSRRPS